MDAFLIYQSAFASLNVDACGCVIGQEWDPATNRLQWALPYKDPCRCPSEGLELGGVSMIQRPLPQRPLNVLYFDAPLEVFQIKKRLNCASEHGEPPDDNLRSVQFRFDADS